MDVINGRYQLVAIKWSCKLEGLKRYKQAGLKRMRVNTTGLSAGNC